MFQQTPYHGTKRGFHPQNFRVAPLRATLFLLFSGSYA